MKQRYRPPGPAVVALAFAAAILAQPAPDRLQATEAWTYADTQPAINPQPWMCASADPGAQLIVHEHRNWHCTWTMGNTPEWGISFVGFHRQFVLDFELYRLNLGGDRVEIWDYGPGAIIPGDDETTSTAFTHCPEYPVADRPAGAVCVGCASLPASLNVTNIGDFPTLGHAGAELNASGWHGSFHINAGVAGGDCNEIASTATAPRDPIFWMGHKKVDDVARTWQRSQAADIVVVLDRSGSMNDDCDNTTDCTGPNPPGDTACRLNAAKNAALLLADLLDDAGVGGDEHRIGLVSFAGTASQDVGLTAASTVVTDNGMNDTPYEAAIAGLQACGATSIGDGILEALDMLAGGSNPHQAIIVLTDGIQNTEPLIDDVADDIGLIQLCAIGIGTGGNEATLRTVAESHGGVFIAQEDLDSGLLTLEKFFVECFAQIFDEVINEDPEFVLPAGQVASEPIRLEVLPSDARLLMASGFRQPPGQGPDPACELQWLITTPSGNLVDPGDPLVEASGGPQWAHTRVRLPYHGEHDGRWRARLIRPQRIFVHGFATDAYAVPLAGVSLVRDEIHRLTPDGAQDVLYYEDGSLTGFSSYAVALQREAAVGHLQNVVQAGSPAEFHALLLEPWDLIVFARQLNPTPQIYDARLSSVLCRVRKGLVTDLYAGNPLFACLGLDTEPGSYQLLLGDGRLVEGALGIVQRGYPAPYQSFFIGQPSEPLIPQGWSEFQLPSIVGSGSPCDDQNAFYTTHTAGVGRVEPANIRPRVLVGQPILATFMMTELNRPLGGWDAVQAEVELIRPGENGARVVYPLYDDGTHGDHNIGNNTWSNLIPDPAVTPGPHRLRARFDLTLGNQTVRREAEYAVIVERVPAPDDCLRLGCNETFEVGAAWQLHLGPCVGNLCAAPRDYSVVAEASLPWLCIEDENGDLIPVGQQFQFTTPPVFPGDPTCFYDQAPLYLCVPAGASPGDEVTVVMTVRDASNPSLPPQICTTTYLVTGTDITPVGEAVVPADFALFEARPNPFNPRTEIGFSIPGTPGQAHHARLQVFDLRGRVVTTLVDEPLPAGHHSVAWDGRDASGRQVAGGVYLYRLDAAGHTATGKLAVLK